MRACRACGYEHETLMRCDVARRIREADARISAVVHAAPAVNRAVQLTPPVVNAEAAPKSRGAYPNTDDRREYMRKKMVEWRAKKRAGAA